MIAGCYLGSAALALVLAGLFVILLALPYSLLPFIRRIDSEAVEEAKV